MTLDRIVVIFIFHDIMNAKRYLTMRRDEVWPIISAWDNIEDLIFMQDGAPPHFVIVVCEMLNFLENKCVVVVYTTGQPEILSSLG